MGNKHSRRNNEPVTGSYNEVTEEPPKHDSTTKQESTSKQHHSAHTHNVRRTSYNDKTGESGNRTHAETAGIYRQNAHYQRDDQDQQVKRVSRTSDSSVREALEHLSPVDMMPRKYSKDTGNANVVSLMTVDPDLVPDVPCKNVIIQVYVYDVYDGDTVRFLMLSGGTEGSILKLSLRILGIDTPEIRGGQGHLAEEKIASELSRNKLAELIGARVSKDPRTPRPRKSVLTKIILREWDKFGGRVLGDIILPDGKSVADIMISEGYARSYNGDKKTVWTMEDLSQPPFNLI